MNEDDYSDIKEIPIYTEKELEKEYETLNTLLIDTNGDWNKRCTALKRLQGLILGGAFHLDNFPAIMGKLYIHLTAQLNDLRSSVSKEACRLVCLAAKISQEKLELLCDRLITRDGLLKLINSGNRVISEQGHECIVTLLEYVRSPKVVGKIADELSSKNTAVRQRISFYLKMIMDIFPESVIEKNLTLLETAINNSIGDANKDVRQQMRQAFLIYAERYPARAAKIQVKFDTSVQKALADEANQGIERMKPVIVPETKPKKAVRERDLSNNREAGQREREIANENKFNRPATTSEKKSRQAPSDSSDGRKEVLIESKGSKINADIGAGGFASEKGPQPRKTKAQNDGITTNLVREMYDTSEKMVNQVSPHFGSPEKKKSTSTTGLTKNPSVLQSRLPEGEYSSRPSTTDTTSSGSKQSLQRQSLKELKKPDAPRYSKPDGGASAINYYQSMKDEDLKFLLDKVKDDNWAVRANSFEKISEFISDLKPNENINAILLEELIESHVKHLNDFHYKVVVACQDSFSKLLTLYKLRIRDTLDRIIPPVFLNLAEGKEKVYASTNFLINLINKIYNGDELYPHFLKALDCHHKAKYKASLLEFMNILIRNCKNYFANSIIIRTCISKFALIMAEFSNNKSIIMPCLGMILYLRDMNFNVTMSAITTLTHEYLSNLRNIASSYATDLEENIRFFNHQQKSPGKLDQVSPMKSPDTRTSYQFENGKIIRKTNFELAPFQTPHFEEEKHSGRLSSGRLKQNARANSYRQLPREPDFQEEIKYETHHTEGYDNSREEQERNENEEEAEQNEGEGEQEPEYDGDGEGEQHDEETGENDFQEPSGENEVVSRESEEFRESPPQTNNKIRPPPEGIKEVVEVPLKSQNSKTEKFEPEPDLRDLNQIEFVVSQYPQRKAWLDDNLDSLICNLVEQFQNKDVTVLEQALGVLKKLMKLPLNFHMQIDQLLSSLNLLYYTPSKLIPLIDEMYKTILCMGYEDLCAHSMIENLAREDHPVIQVLIKHITQLYLKKLTPELINFLPDLMERFKDLINHTNPDVRKNVVFSIVDLHFVAKTHMQKFIEEFSPSHQKLINIYIQKRSEKSTTAGK